VALLEKHRSSIYQNLAPIVGEEAAEAMLMHFPRTEADEPITREHLDRRFAELRTEVHQLFARALIWMFGMLVALLTIAVTVLISTLG
jgi:hypothetical protein